MAEKQLMKIAAAQFGFGGYNDAQFGLALDFRSKNCGVSAFIGGWSMERSGMEQWTEQDRRDAVFDAAWRLKDTLQRSGKRHVAELVGIPVEVEIEQNALKSWRVLEEVL